ncbi:rhodanese domain protein [Candidatus Rickettsiella viridis]|uniref:Rhodanese domain protein n=2 Tax=Candidatus Rickettsiella viridis TaxID=676208 RepID=A0A2Z5UUN1_9COXI|nr:rhodanese domain protein [Candidatus Rickettsiella viridis]
MIHEDCKLSGNADKHSSAKRMQHTSGFLNLVADAKSRITEISISDLADKLIKVPFYLIDVRELDEYKQGAIPNAIHLSKGTIERDIERLIPDNAADIVVYCSGGFRSCLVADNLQKMGYQHVASLTGGVRAWLEAGYPLAT